MITYVDFQRICREEGVAERFIDRLWDSRRSFTTKTGRDPVHFVSEQALRMTLKMILERWPYLLKEPS